MQASTLNGTCLARLSEILKEFLDAVNIMFAPEGMSASAFDVNEIALITFTIPKDAFEQYLCRDIYPACLNMNVFHNVLKAVGTTRSALTLKIDPEHKDAMIVKIYNSDTKTEAENKLKLWLFPTDHLDIPNSLFDFYIEMPSQYLMRNIGYLSALMNNENIENKTIEVYANSNGEFELAVEGEFGTTRLKIGSEAAGVKVHEGPTDPFAEDFGMPVHDLICDDEGSEGSGDEGGDDGDDEKANGDDRDEQDEAEEEPEETVGKKRKPKPKKAPKKQSKKAKTAGGGKKKGGGAASSSSFVPVPNRGSVVDEATVEVAQQRTAAQRPPVREKFIIKYFKSIAKAASLSPTVLIFVRECFPIIFLYRIGMMGKLCFCLSPAADATAAGAKDVGGDQQDEIDGGEMIDPDADVDDKKQIADNKAAAAAAAATATTKTTISTKTAAAAPVNGNKKQDYAKALEETVEEVEEEEAEEDKEEEEHEDQGEEEEIVQE